MFGAIDRVPPPPAEGERERWPNFWLESFYWSILARCRFIQTVKYSSICNGLNVLTHNNLVSKRGWSSFIILFFFFFFFYWNTGDCERIQTDTGREIEKKTISIAILHNNNYNNYNNNNNNKKKKKKHKD